MNYLRQLSAFTFSALLLVFAPTLPAQDTAITAPPNETYVLPQGTPFTPDPYAYESREERDQRMAWWRDARFGMFIHWGPYAVPAGTYKGQPVERIGEWIMVHGQIPIEEYKAFAREFQPTQYDPKFWAQLAKNAGMRYLVITSKHHDGFALFPSAVTDWDIADASPYGRDLIGPLAEAARAEGLKFGLYYSQTQDWVHPGGGKSGFRSRGTHWDEAQLGDFNDYLRDIAIPQVGEILARYQPDVLWWDTPMGMRTEHAEPLISLLRSRPGIIHNNRLGGGFMGDTETPEQHIPATGFKDRDWEVCMTMNDTWGYKSYDENWKSTETLLEKLCDTVSKGGNFLLNIGPRADGTIPQPSIDRLEEVGKWMSRNGESIHGTTASLFYRLPWGRSTTKTTEKDTTLYLQVFDWPKDGRLEVPGLVSKPVSAELLDGGQAVTAKQAGDHLVLTLPKEAPDAHVSVIKMQFDGPPDIVSTMPAQSADGRLELTAEWIDLHNSGYREQAFLKDGRVHGWASDRAWMSWTFRINEPGPRRVVAEIAAASPTEMTIGLADRPRIPVEIQPTDTPSKLRTVDLGEVNFPKPGIYQLEFRPVRDKWKAIELGRVVLQ